jgi:hypothetical protein
MWPIPRSFVQFAELLSHLPLTDFAAVDVVYPALDFWALASFEQSRLLDGRRAVH